MKRTAHGNGGVRRIGNGEKVAGVVRRCRLQNIPPVDIYAVRFAIVTVFRSSCSRGRAGGDGVGTTLPRRWHTVRVMPSHPVHQRDREHVAI